MSTLLERAQAITNETAVRSITPAQIGGLFEDIITSTVLIQVKEDERTASEGDLVYINEAISDLSDAGGGTIKLQSGSYISGTAGYLDLKSNVTLIGECGVSIDFSGRTSFSTDAAPLIRAFGDPQVEGSYVDELLTVDADKYDNFLHFDTTNFQDGDLIFIFRNETFYTIGAGTGQMGELIKIKSIISPTAVELSNILQYNYPVSDTATVRRIAYPAENVTLDNIEFIGKGNNVTEGTWGNSDTGFVSQWAANIVVKNCTFRNIQTRNCCFIHTFGFKAFGNRIYFDPIFNSNNIQYGLYYGNTTCYGDVYDNWVFNGKHAIVDGYLNSLVGGITRNITVHHNYLLGQWHAPIAEHEGSCENMTYHNNTIIGSQHGIDIRCPGARVIDNTIVLRRTTAESAWTTATSYVMGDYVSVGTGEDVQYFMCYNDHTSSESTEPLEGVDYEDYWFPQYYVKIVGEVVTETPLGANVGIWLRYQARDVEISGNKIYNAYYGMFNPTTYFGLYDNHNIKIKDNLFKNGVVGIYLFHLKSADCLKGWEISNNTFDTLSNYAIYLRGKVSAKIKDNIFNDVTSEAIYLLGVVDTEVENNKIDGTSVGVKLQDSVTTETVPTTLVLNNVSIKNNNFLDATTAISNTATGVVKIKENDGYYVENINVIDFGVLSSNSGTENATAIQLAVTAASTNETTLYFNDGEYEIEGQISVPSNITIVGTDFTVIKPLNAPRGTGYDIFKNSDQSSGNENIKFYNLTFDWSGFPDVYNWEPEMEVELDMLVNNLAYEAILEIDVTPTEDWERGDTITGASSSATCVVVGKATDNYYYVEDVTGTFTSGEIIGVTGNADKLADQGVGYPIVSNGMTLGVYKCLSLDGSTTVPGTDSEVWEYLYLMYDTAVFEMVKVDNLTIEKCKFYNIPNHCIWATNIDGAKIKDNYAENVGTSRRLTSYNVENGSFLISYVLKDAEISGNYLNNRDHPWGVCLYVSGQSTNSETVSCNVNIHHNTIIASRDNGIRIENGNTDDYEKIYDIVVDSNILIDIDGSHIRTNGHNIVVSGNICSVTEDFGHWEIDTHTPHGICIQGYNINCYGNIVYDPFQYLTHGIRITDVIGRKCYNVKVTDNIIYGCEDSITAYIVKYVSGGINNLGSFENISVIDNECYNPLNYGIRFVLSASGDDSEAKNIRIINNLLKEIGGYAVRVEHVNRLYIIDNIIENSNYEDGGNTSAIYIDGCTNGKVEHNEIFDDRTPKIVNYGVRMNGTNEKVHVRYNNFEVLTKGYYVGSGATNTSGIISNNEGFVTENSGTAIIGSADDPPSSTINHLLDITPTPGQIRITPTSDIGDAKHWWVSDVGATSFKINLDEVSGSAVTFEWRVVI